MTARSCVGTSALRTAVSPPRKRGAQSREDEARQRYEVDAFGRWRGYSAGSTPGLGVPGGGHAPREDPRHRRRNADASTGPTAVLPGSSDRRSGLRQQSLAGLVEDPRHRTDHPGTKQQPPGDSPGWSTPATVRSSLDHRADLRMDRVVSAAAGAP